MSAPPKSNVPERAIKVASHFHSENPCPQIKREISGIIEFSNAERQEMDKLNSRMSAYVGQVVKLEQENKELIDQIHDMRTNWGFETNGVKEEYELVISDIRSRVDTVAHLKTIAEVSYRRANYEHDEHRRKIEENNLVVDITTNKINRLECELTQLRESHSCLLQATEAELQLYARYKKNRDEAMKTLQELLDKLDDELFKRIGMEYNNQTLREQLEFIWQVNQRELVEMSHLSQVLPFNEQVDFYKDQLKRVISLIRRDYETMHTEQTIKMEDWMRAKKEELEQIYAEKDPIHDLEISLNVENSAQLKEVMDRNEKEMEELKADNEKKLKKLCELEDKLNWERDNVGINLDKQQDEVSVLTEELNALTNDYNSLNVSKSNLEYEINIYKRLLDSQLKKDEPKGVLTLKDDKPLKEPPAQEPAESAITEPKTEKQDEDL